MIVATNNGLIYNSETNEVISDFEKGNQIFLAKEVKIFYGTIEEFKSKI